MQNDNVILYKRMGLRSSPSCTSHVPSMHYVPPTYDHVRSLRGMG